MSTFTGTSASDSFTGTSGDDTFNMAQGGVDTVKGGGGNDTFNFGGALTAADTIQGGLGFDILHIDGDYSSGLTFQGTTMKGVEEITLGDGHDYKLIFNNGNAAAGAVLSVNGIDLTGGHTLYCDASAETDAAIALDGGAGNDTLIGGQAGNALESSGKGGEDTMIGGADADAFYFDADFDAGDRVDGKGGTVNTIFLAGDYSAGLTLGANTIVNVTSFNFSSFGTDYKLILNDGNVAAGASLLINGENLTVGHSLYLDGKAETDGKLNLLGGAGKDTLIGGHGADHLQGSGAADKLKGGAGADTFVYAAAADSAGLGHDSIINFDAASDKFDLWYTLAGINAAITSGTLNKASFVSDLSTAADAAHLSSAQAVLFTPTAGDQAGKTFLIVDANGTAGYQSDDLVVDVSHMAHAGSFGLANFV
jgi:Ca2+-binding RTX toxin-like protein